MYLPDKPCQICVQDAPCTWRPCPMCRQVVCAACHSRLKRCPYCRHKWKTPPFQLSGRMTRLLDASAIVLLLVAPITWNGMWKTYAMATLGSLSGYRDETAAMAVLSFVPTTLCAWFCSAFGISCSSQFVSVATESAVLFTWTLFIGDILSVCKSRWAYH